jgi:hypothetical protein
VWGGKSQVVPTFEVPASPLPCLSTTDLARGLRLKGNMQGNNKSLEGWHHWEYLEEVEMGEQEVAISITYESLKKFMDQCQKRLDRKTGVRIKFAANARKKITKSRFDLYRGFEFYSKKDDYVYPEKSAHTDRYDSELNRVEFFVDIDKAETEEECRRLRATHLNYPSWSDNVRLTNEMAFYLSSRTKQ